MTERLDALEAEAARAFESAKDPGSLEEVRVRLLGRKSELTGILRGLKDLSPEERTVIGARANRLRESWESRYKEALSSLASSNDASGSAPAALHDVTLPGRAIPRGPRPIPSTSVRTSCFARTPPRCRSASWRSRSRRCGSSARAACTGT